MKGFLVILFFLIFSPAAIHAAEYSLEELYMLALRRSETVRIAEEDISISEYEKGRARAVLYPSFSAFGYHTRYDREKRQNLSLLQPETRNEWGLRLDHSLSLSGREITAFEIAKQGIEKSRYDKDSIKEEYLITTASSYYELLKSIKARQIAGSNVKRLEKHRDAAKIRLKVGTATKTVVLRAEAELAGAESELIRSNNAMRLAKAVLARTVGIDEDYGVREKKGCVDPADIELTVLRSINEGCGLPVLACLKEKAFKERPEIDALSLQMDISEKEVKYAKGAHWPSLSIEGVYRRQEDSPESTFGLREQMYGAIKLNIPIFEGGLRAAEVKQARSRFHQAEYRLSDIKKSIGIEVENAYMQVLTASALIAGLEAETRYAQDNYNAVSKQFNYGLADSVDVIDANTLLVNAERELANARYDLELALLQVRRSTGTLLEAVSIDQD